MIPITSPTTSPARSPTKSLARSPTKSPTRSMRLRGSRRRSPQRCATMGRPPSSSRTAPEAQTAAQGQSRMWRKAHLGRPPSDGLCPGACAEANASCRQSAGTAKLGGGASGQFDQCCRLGDDANLADDQSSGISGLLASTGAAAACAGADAAKALGSIPVSTEGGPGGGTNGHGVPDSHPKGDHAGALHTKLHRQERHRWQCQQRQHCGRRRRQQQQHPRLRRMYFAAPAIAAVAAVAALATAPRWCPQ